MKKFLSLCFVISFLMLSVPLAVLGENAKVKAHNNGALLQNNGNTPFETTSFLVYNKETGQTLKMSADEYIFCVVAAEMPALYDSEALKAQAVAAYTFALSRKKANAGKGFDITTDYTTDQSFKAKEQAISDWGEKGEEYAAKIEKAVQEVSGLALTYNGEIITAAYHAVSAGKTQDSADVWGKDRPYLKSVLSEGDKLNKNYISKVTFSETELLEKLGDLLENVSAITFESSEKTKGGYIKTISICGKNLTGSQIRDALELKSTCFEIEKTDGVYNFTVYGYGHGVGMSQAGADYMAKQGANYKEILKHYYTNCQIEKV